MSQHVIPAINDRTHVTVGYDRPLRHFFATVMVDGDVAYFSPGTNDIVELRAEIAPYAELPIAVAKEIMGERDGSVPHSALKYVDHR